MPTPAIHIKDLHKNYAELKAVKGISFDIKQGEFFALLGQNGAGKSTTINILTGLSNKTSGTVKIFNSDVSQNYQSARKRIGLVPQEFNMDKFEIVEKFLDFNAGYFGIAKEQRKIRITHVLKELGLENKRHSKILMLSGGMKRRLLIARALLHDPDILILDEPTAGVDVESRRSIWETMQRFNKAGKTILLTTHYIEEAEELADRVAIIHHGKIIKIDTKQNIMQQFGKDLVTLHFKSKISKVPSEIMGQKPTLGSDKSSLQFIFDHQKFKQKDLLQTITKSKAESFEISKAKLEDIFVELTKGESKK
ncbi:ABC transporter ATP-binding protein [archaeon]|jgi:ABC-2 type transport system ATP-binding protein|nr:ABC transporter ATP-binding protein [archaeon]MBT6761438.1 ABC transporter ATP-binding protein [archaeon]